MTNKEKISVLSLGWGVQSFTLAAMAALDEIEKPDLVVFADTTHENASAYKLAEDFTSWLGERGVTVETVQAKSTQVESDKNELRKLEGRYFFGSSDKRDRTWGLIEGSQETLDEWETY